MNFTYEIVGNKLYIYVTLHQRRLWRDIKFVVLGDTIHNYFLTLPIKHEEWILAGSDFCANTGNVKKLNGIWTYEQKVLEILPDISDNADEGKQKKHSGEDDKPKKPKKSSNNGNNRSDGELSGRASSK